MSTRESSGGEPSSGEESPVKKINSLKEIYKSCTFALNIPDPFSYEEAAKDEVWREAMREELEAINRNDTWELVDLPPNKKTVQLKWVYKTKYHSEGEYKSTKLDWY